MEPHDLLPLQAATLRAKIEALIGAVDGAAYDTQQPTYKRALGQVAQVLGRWCDQTHTDAALELLVQQYQEACLQAAEVTHAEGAPIAALYAWLSWYLETMRAGTVPDAAKGLALAEAVLALLSTPQPESGQPSR